jgi:hypothetical protein
MRETLQRDTGRGRIPWWSVFPWVVCFGCATVPTTPGDSPAGGDQNSPIAFFYQEGDRFGATIPAADIVGRGSRVLVVNTGRAGIERAVRSGVLREQHLQYFENGLIRNLLAQGLRPVDKTNTVRFRPATESRNQTQFVTPLDVSDWRELSAYAGADILVDYAFVNAQANTGAPHRPYLWVYVKVIDLRRNGAILFSNMQAPDKPDAAFTAAREAARTLPAQVLEVLNQCVLVDMSPSIEAVGTSEPLTPGARRMLPGGASLAEPAIRRLIEAGLVSGLTSLKPGCILEKLPTFPERPLWRFPRLSLYADPVEQEVAADILEENGCRFALYYRHLGSPASFFVRLVELKQRRVVWAGIIGSEELPAYYTSLLADLHKDPVLTAPSPAGTCVVLAEDSLMLPEHRSQRYTWLHAGCAEALCVALLLTQPSLSQQYRDLYIEPVNSPKYDRVETLHNPFMLANWRVLAAQGVTTAFLYDVVRRDGQIHTHIKRIDTASGVLVGSAMFSYKEVR